MYKLFHLKCIFEKIILGSGMQIAQHKPAGIGENSLIIRSQYSKNYFL